MSKNENVPIVSVVMSVYNSGEFLRDAIDSILAQTYEDFEFVIIDDGSTDESNEIIKSYNDKRIVLIEQPNKGLVASLNTGIDIARGMYIARMDADDISLPERFEREVAQLDNNPKLGLVGTYFQYMDETTSERLKTVIFAPTKHIDLVRMMYLVNPFGHGSVMLRKDAVQKAGGYRAEFDAGEDYDLWHRISENWEICQIPKVLYLWRVNPNSISHVKQVVQNKTAARVVNELLKESLASKTLITSIKDAKYYRQLDSPFKDLIYHQYIDQQMELALLFLIRGNLYIGYKCAITALYYKPGKIKKLGKTMVWAPFRFILVRLGLKK
jgi:glycosyltransferase involved in cell wall biosynthesis